MDISMWRPPAVPAAMLILVAYAGHRMVWMFSCRVAHDILNAMGSANLGYIAFHLPQICFLTLEVTWTLISICALLRQQVQE
jgi:hypothetical protein